MIRRSSALSFALSPFNRREQRITGPQGSPTKTMSNWIRPLRSEKLGGATTVGFAPSSSIAFKHRLGKVLARSILPATWRFYHEQHEQGELYEPHEQDEQQKCISKCIRSGGDALVPGPGQVIGNRFARWNSPRDRQ